MGELFQNPEKHVMDFGMPVSVGGLTVNPGDLIMGDKHGVISIPQEIATDVPQAAKMVEDWEQRVIDFCKTEAFSLEGLTERYQSPRPVLAAALKFSPVYCHSR